MRLPSRCRCAFSVACTLASPALTRACVSSTASALALSLNCACSGLAAVLSVPSSVPSTRARHGAPVVGLFVVGALAFGAAGIGTPLSCSVNAPPARSGGTLACKRAGSTSASCNCNCSSLPAHWPRPCTRPADWRSSASHASSCRISMRSSRLGVPPSSSWSSRTGNRPLSQRPGSWFCTRTDACAGRSRPALCTLAWASMRVRGAALLSAARSNDRVDSCNAASGQLANGSMRARTSTLGALALRSSPRKVARTVKSASGPSALTLACQGVPLTGVACSCSASGSGAAVPMRALALNRTRSLCSDKSWMRCSVPSLSPR